MAPLAHASAAVESAPRPAQEAGLCRAERLVSKRSFERLMKRGRRYHGEIFAVHVLAGQTAKSRLGLIVSRKAGNSPKRNRLKRLMREAFRKNKYRLARPMDIVLRAREGSGEHPHRLADVERELLRVFALIEKDFAS